MSSIQKFIEQVQSALESKEFQRLTLSAPNDLAKVDGVRKQTLRIVEVRQDQMLQWTRTEQKRETHENLPFQTSLQLLSNLITDHYSEANLQTTQTQFILQRRGKRSTLRTVESKTPAAAPVLSGHNRKKNYIIPEGQPCPFLESLGIMSAEGRVYASKQKKFRQINRYLEIVRDIVPNLSPTGPLRIVDFGCGLSYLTFGLHYLLTEILNRDVELLGIDRNADVIARCTSVANELQLAGLSFSTGNIEDVPQSKEIDLSISLHACDIATDAALAFAVAAESKAILAVPCCQHELLRSIQNEPLTPLLSHGILAERFAALTTDALRGAALEAAGYRTQVLEFIDLEHTPKNILIRAVQRSGGHETVETTTYRQFKETLGLGEIATDQVIAAAERVRQQPTT